MGAHLKAILSVVVVMLISFLGVYFYLGESKILQKETHKVNDEVSLTLPQEKIKLMDGGGLSPSEFKGKIIILNFWASWCSPCIEEVPSLIELTKKNNHVIVLAVSGDKNKEEIMAFIKSFPEFNKEPFYQVWDDNEKWLKSFHIIKLPESFIFNSKGEMVKRISGTINWNTADSLSYFSSLD